VAGRLGTPLESEGGAFRHWERRSSCLVRAFEIVASPAPRAIPAPAPCASNTPGRMEPPRKAPRLFDPPRGQARFAPAYPKMRILIAMRILIPHALRQERRVNPMVTAVAGSLERSAGDRIPASKVRLPMGGSGFPSCPLITGSPGCGYLHPRPGVRLAVAFPNPPAIGRGPAAMPDLGCRGAALCRRGPHFAVPHLGRGLPEERRVLVAADPPSSETAPCPGEAHRGLG